MRRTVLFLSLFSSLLTILAAPSASEARRPRLEVASSMVISGTPVALEVEVENLRPNQQLVAMVLLDGRKVGSAKLRNGSNSIELPEVRPGSGDHALEVRSGNLTATVDVSLLPGWLSVIPPLVAIVLALIFRDVLLSLFAGIFVGALALHGWNPFSAFGRTLDTYVVPALADADHISILVFTSLLGAMVGLVTKSGGTHGIVEMLMPYATSTKRGQLATWAMGLLIFFDDYANTLIVGPTMRPITDKLRISREKLAYIVDSTAAPVVCLFPISTWVGFEIGLIGNAYSDLGISADAYTTFLASIPYRFYPFFALMMVVSIAASGFDFGAMRRAEQRARTTGQLLAPGAQPIADYSTEEVEPPADAPKRALNAILPIVTVVVVVLIGLYLTGRSSLAGSGADIAALQADGSYWRNLLAEANSYNALLWASLAGVSMAFVLSVGQRILKIAEAAAAAVAGIKAMLLALLVLTMAWALASVCDGLNTAQYLVGLTEHSLSPSILPALTFVLAAAVAFATGSSWGTMGILEPLVIPIAHQLLLSNAVEPGSPAYLSVMLGTIASVLTGAVWGDHCSPISDTTILSSMASGCDHIAHVRTQLPYALGTGILAIVMGLVTSLTGISPWIPLAVGCLMIVSFVYGMGRRQQAIQPDEVSEPSI